MASGSKDADQSPRHQKYKDLISTLPLELPPMDPRHALSTKDDDETSKEVDQSPHQTYKDLISALPLEASLAPFALRKYQGFWFPKRFLSGVMALQGQFVARQSDILLITLPKSGTTWLKALAYATMHRNKYASTDHPLLTTNPHDCVPFVEMPFLNGQAVELHNFVTPRLLAAHSPLSVLPSSVIDSGCRIIYLCRDPKDVLVSWWHFLQATRLAGSMDVVTLNHVFELFCAGIALFGPIWNHILEHWRESQRRPEKVLFLKYEDMIKNIEGSLRSLAEFMGCAFSDEEEKGGMVEKIIKLCSFNKLSNLDVNKSGRLKIAEDLGINSQNTMFFRKGKMEDWKNYLTREMAQKLDEITEEKLHGSGLSFF